MPELTPSHENHPIRRYARKIRAMMRFADELKELATDPTIQTATVIFPYDCSRVLAIGYNGAPAGFREQDIDRCEHNTESGSGFGHAEMNALTKMNTWQAPKCVLYTTYSPCRRCATHIINSGVIGHVIYSERYGADPIIPLHWLAAADIKTLERSAVEAAAQGLKNDVHRTTHTNVSIGDTEVAAMRWHAKED